MEVDPNLLIPAEIAGAIVDPSCYADHRIHDTYSWLRAHNPLGVANVEGFDPFWVVTKHDDILNVSKNNEIFHNGDGQATLADKETDSLIRQITGGSPHLIKSLVQMDAPEHPKYRNLAQSWFLPQNLRKLEARIRIIARASIDRMSQLGSQCDFVKDIALLYPLHVIMEILGVPEADEARMLRLTQELFGPQDPDAVRTADAGLDPDSYGKVLTDVVDDFEEYFTKLSENRRVDPREDFASVIATATIDGKPLPRHEQMGYYMIIATAGHDTTSSSTSTAIWQLCEQPEQFRKLKANPALIPSMVDEAIRIATPVKHFMRTATRDTELRNRHVRRGDWLMLCYASGNRDESVFEAPFEFRIDRKPNRHIAFGSGAHACLGQHLAKLEMRVFFEELIPRLDALESDGPVVQSQAFFVNGPKRLPICYQLS